MKTKTISIVLLAALIAMAGTTRADAAEVPVTVSENGAAQQSLIKISGIVKDMNGQPIPGATVVIKSRNAGTVTGVDGRFSIDAAVGDQLSISFVGYVSQELVVNSATSYDITLEEDAAVLEDVVVVGYGVQKKATLTGSVAAVQNDDIIKTKNENIQNMLTGKVPGLRVVQQSSEPGAFAMNFDIRGMGDPLIVIDGIPRDNIERLYPTDVVSI